MYRDFGDPYGLPLDSALFVWELADPSYEDEVRRSAGNAPDLAAALRRCRLPTGLAATPTFYQLVERWRPVHAPELPTTFLVALSSVETNRGWNDATHGSPPSYTSPEFYELGVFQVPAGLHGHCTNQGCEHAPPGPEKPRSPSAWSRICARLGLNPNRWQDPITQVRVGLCNLESDAQILRNRYAELFPQPGSDWDLRAAVLLPFIGIGIADGLLKRHRQKLSQLPEADRFRYLIAQEPRMGYWLNKVEERMKPYYALVAYFAAHPGR